MVLNHVYFLYFRSWRTLSSKLNQLGEILHICKRGKHRRMAEKNIGCRPLKAGLHQFSAGHLGRQMAIQGRRPLWPAYIYTAGLYWPAYMQAAGLGPAFFYSHSLVFLCIYMGPRSICKGSLSRFSSSFSYFHCSQISLKGELKEDPILEKTL